MNAIKRYWIDFAAWVKGRNRRLQFQPIPVESWAERKAAYDRAQRTHHGRGEASAALRKATYESIKREVLDKEDEALRVLIETRSWLFSRDPDAFDAAVKAIARRRIEEARLR